MANLSKFCDFYFSLNYSLESKLIATGNMILKEHALMNSIAMPGHFYSNIQYKSLYRYIKTKLCLNLLLVKRF